MNVDIKKMAEEIIYWEEQYNKSKEILQDIYGSKMYKASIHTIEETIELFRIKEEIPECLKFKDNEIDINKVKPICCETILNESSKEYIKEENERIIKEGNNEINGIKVE